MTAGVDIREVRELAGRLRHLLRCERLTWSSVELARTGQRLLELGAPAVPSLLEAYREIDPRPLPSEMVAGLSAALPGAPGGPGHWAPFGPALGCAARSRATIRHWIRRLGFLAGEEQLLSLPAVLQWTAAAQALTDARLPYLLEAAEDLPGGPERDALLWFLRWRHHSLLGAGASGRPEGELLDLLRAQLPRELDHWVDVEPAVVERFAARGLVAADAAGLERHGPERAPLTAEEERSGELAVLRLCGHGRWTWAEVSAAVERHPRLQGTAAPSREALAAAGLLAAVRFEPAQEGWVTTSEGALAGALAAGYQWPFGPCELRRFAAALQGAAAEREAAVASLAGEPRRLSAALHQALWCEGPVLPLVAAVVGMARHPAPAVRAAFLDGLASRLQPPGGTASQERPAGPDGLLLPAAEWGELVRAGGADPEVEVREAAERLAAALHGGGAAR